MLTPCCSGDLLRGPGIGPSGLSVVDKSAPLRLHRLVGSSVEGIEELADETSGVREALFRSPSVVTGIAVTKADAQ